MTPNKSHGREPRRGVCRSCPLTDLEAQREAAGLPVSRFCVLADTPEPTYRRRRGRLRDGQFTRGPWPALVADRIEALAAKYAETWPACDYREIVELTRDDGPVSSYPVRSFSVEA